MLALAALTTSTADAVTKVPHRCTSKPAPRLCSIHFHRHRTNVMRSKMNLHPIPYHWIAEKYPARRGRVLTYWVGVHKRTVTRLKNYHPSNYAGLLCIHGYEGSWTAYNSSGPYYGGLQMDSSFMQHWGSDMLSKYGGRDARSWSPQDQLIVGARAVAHIGYSPWPTTARMCHLL